MPPWRLYHACSLYDPCQWSNSKVKATSPCPRLKAPPWTWMATGSLRVLFEARGRYILTVRQSSSYASWPPRKDLPGQTGPYSLAWMVSVEFGSSSRGRKRLDPVGGRAYGIPRNASIGSGKPSLRNLPMMVPWRSNTLGVESASCTGLCRSQK